MIDSSRRDPTATCVPSRERRLPLPPQRTPTTIWASAPHARQHFMPARLDRSLPRVAQRPSVGPASNRGGRSLPDVPQFVDSKLDLSPPRDAWRHRAERKSTAKEDRDRLSLPIPPPLSGPDIPTYDPTQFWPGVQPPVMTSADKAAAEIAAKVGSLWWKSCDELETLFFAKQALVRHLFFVALVQECMGNIDKQFLPSFWKDLAACGGGLSGPPVSQVLPQLCHLSGCSNCGDNFDDDAICVLEAMEASTKAFAPLSPLCPELYPSLTGKVCKTWLNRHAIWHLTAVDKTNLDSIVHTVLGTHRHGDPTPSAGPAANAIWLMRTVLAVAAIRGCSWPETAVYAQTAQPFTEADFSDSPPGSVSFFTNRCIWGTYELAAGDLQAAKSWSNALCG